MGKVGSRLADILCDVGRRRGHRRKTRVFMDLWLGAGPASRSRAPAGLSGCDLGTRPAALPALRLVPLAPGRGQARLAYFAALAPAAAAKPSCWPVPPLAPIAPMILPFTMIGRPPSDATGFSGKVVNAVLPAAY